MNVEAALPQHDESLKRAIGYSVGFHLVVIAMLTLRAVFYPTEALQIETAIRVDMVALPDKSTAKLPPAPAAEIPAPPVETAEAKPEPQPEPVAKPALPVPAPAPAPAPVAKVAKPDSPKVSLDKSKRTQEAALKRMEALSRLEKMVKSQQSNQKAAAPVSASAPIKGNEISRGSALSGVARLDHQNYLGDLDQHVKRFWNLPQWMAGANFKARVVVYIDSKGFVTKKVVTRSSNNSDFDERVLRAVDEASPFPPPPANLVGLFAVDGVELGFPE